MRLDLASWHLWAFVAVAMLGNLVPALDARARQDRWYAALNLAFIAALLGVGTSAHESILGAGTLVGWVVLPLVVFWLALRVLATPSTSAGARIGVLALVTTALGFAFVVHKRPDLQLAAGSSLDLALGVLSFSYVLLRAIDLVRDVHETRESPTLAATIRYLVPFHMLAAGPIQAWRHAKKHAGDARRVDMAAALSAIERIVWGLFKKYALARTIEEVFFSHGGAAEGAYFWIEVQLFYLWVYLDFSAYSDIAIGIGRLLGLDVPENFARPLLARNIIVFWERWHISLSEWVRRNLFVPVSLVLVRRDWSKLAAASVAFLVAFLLCGAWHGLTLVFVIWGAMHAVALLLCNYYKAWLARRLSRDVRKRYDEHPLVRVVATAITFEYVALSLTWVRRGWEVFGG